MRLLPRWEEALVVLAYAAHVVLVPGTKVEESFTLHATRDVVVRGTDSLALQQYDHVEFAGAVPRSFVPPVALAALSKPALQAAASFGWMRTRLHAQITVRLVLAFVSALALIFLSRRVRTTFGARTAKYALVLLATQFHVPFWAGRTVPNMLAFPLVQIALGLFISPPVLQALSRPRFATRRNTLCGFSLLTFAAIVIRLELAALLVPFALENLLQGSVGFVELAGTGIVSAAISLVTTISVDSYFWQSSEWLWPEGHAFLFNVVEGRSSDWGTSPPLYYFTSALPRLLHLSLLPAIASFSLDRRSRRLLLPCIVFVALLSLLKHKEWRFIVYVVPAFTVAAAGGVVALGAFTASPRTRRLALLALIGANLLFTSFGLVASTHNYPGLDAVSFLTHHLAAEPASRSNTVSVHVGVEAKMTGASNFVLLGPAAPRPSNASAGVALSHVAKDSNWAQTGPRPVFSRSEDPAFGTLAGLALAGQFDYALVDSDAADWTRVEAAPGVQVLYEAPTFAGFDPRAVVRRGKVGDFVKTRPSVRVVKFDRRA